MHAGCPAVWASQTQTETALSSAESEVVGPAAPLRASIPVTELLKEMKSQGFQVLSVISQVHCQAFGDNSGAAEIASIEKIRPRTKHPNNKLFHF
jgi:hypothetical protein